MSSPVVQPSTFDVSKVSISQPKVLDSGGKMAYLNYGEKRLLIQTPSLPAPFGMSVFDKAGPPKYSVDLALRGYQDQPKPKALFAALQKLDEYMIDQGVKNSKAWFKADMKREVVEAFYTPCVRFGRDKQGNQTSYPPNLKVQLRRKRDGSDFECLFYDQKSKGDPDAQPLRGIPAEELLVKRSEMTALIECTGVWFAGGKFGVSWKARSLNQKTLLSEEHTSEPDTRALNKRSHLRALHQELLSGDATQGLGVRVALGLLVVE